MEDVASRMNFLGKARSIATHDHTFHVGQFHALHPGRIGPLEIFPK
jgi:hypothetical protein